MERSLYVTLVTGAKLQKHIHRFSPRASQSAYQQLPEKKNFDYFPNFCLGQDYFPNFIEVIFPLLYKKLN
jgi:hypothetical protein